MLRKQKARIEARVKYRWTDDASKLTASVPLVIYGVEEWITATADGSITGNADALDGFAGRVFAGKTAGLPAFTACPGFKLQPPDAATGVQRGSVVPTFDMNSL